MSNQRCHQRSINQVYSDKLMTEIKKLSLNQYKAIHDKILIILTDWILQQCKAERKILVDLDGGNFNPLSELFQSLRPDLAILEPNNDIYVLELTNCPETNCNKSRQQKLDNWGPSIRDYFSTEFSNYSVVVKTIEITCLGLVSDCS